MELTERILHSSKNQKVEQTGVRFTTMRQLQIFLCRQSWTCSLSAIIGSVPTAMSSLSSLLKIILQKLKLTGLIRLYIHSCVQKQRSYVWQFVRVAFRDTEQGKKKKKRRSAIQILPFGSQGPSFHHVHNSENSST